jgi:hypothetical protein
MNMKKTELKTCVLLFATAVWMLGCASSSPTVKFKTKFSDSYSPSNFSSITMKVSTADNKIKLTEQEIERIAGKIINEFKKDPLYVNYTFNASSTTETINVECKIMNYDRGNAFARAMLAGLGSMNIKAEIIVENSKTGELLAEFTVSKTFAWGGVYGAGTNMSDIEEGFAKGVLSGFKNK